MPFPVLPPRRGRPRPRPRPVRLVEEVLTRINPRIPRLSRSLRSPQWSRFYRLARRLPAITLPVAAVTVVLVVAVAPPAFADAGSAATSLNSVIDNLRNWLVGILAAVATLFLTVGGLRYLTAGGDPTQVEKAKTALKSAAIGYALAALAPLLVSILASLVA